MYCRDKRTREGWQTEGAPHHGNFHIEAFINIAQIRRNEGKTYQPPTGAVTLPFSSNLLHVPKSRQAYCIIILLIKLFFIYLHSEIVLWAKSLLNDALPTGSAATWTEQHPLGSSVRSYSTWRVKGPTTPSQGYYTQKTVFFITTAERTSDFTTSLSYRLHWRRL
jgi:hypothetical protein